MMEIKKKEPKEDKPQKYNAPQALSPVNGSMINGSDSKMPLEFNGHP